VKLKPYTGHTPSNVSKDAKYTVSSAGEVRLTYRINLREKELLTTSKHPKLVEMVNVIKQEINGVPGGVFYINEFGDVLVPGREVGTCHWAGHYVKTLKFTFGDGYLSPEAPAGLRPGDKWPGPHPGVRYVLKAGGNDIRYQRKSGNRVTEIYLSDEVGQSAAKATAARIRAIKGPDGGRFYINERCELFAPVASNDYEQFVYLGHLEDSAWFDPPEGYDRP
jgi:hypothetical protein